LHEVWFVLDIVYHNHNISMVSVRLT
jgi:hypothetical protein